MPWVLLLAVLATVIIRPAAAQTNAAEQDDLMQIRLKMSHDVSDAINKKDATLVADHYSKDVVLSVLSPVQTIVVGRDAMLKRGESVFKDSTNAQEKI